MSRLRRRVATVGCVLLSSLVAFDAGGQRASSASATPATLGDSVRVLTMALLDVTVIDALERLSGAARMNIVWQQASLGARADRRVSCRVDRGMPEAMLRCITRAADLDYYRLSSGTYVVIAAAEAPTQWASLGGFVVDANTGAALPSARVQLAEAPSWITAGNDGVFTVARLRPGRYGMTVRALGYRPYTATLDIPARTARRIRVALQRTEAAIHPIVINGIRAGDASAALGASVIDDSATRHVIGPALFLPGAVAPLGVTRRDGTGDLHLQGGDVGEHPWRLDGIPLYDVTTLSGFLGVVSPLVVDRITVHRAGFGAAVGSFASGAIDLTQGLGGTAATSGVSTDVAIDPLTATARVTSPLTVGQASGRVMLAARTGLWQWTAPSAMVRAVRHWSTPDPVLLARVSDFGVVPGMEQLERTQYATSIGDESVSVNDVHAAATLDWGTAQSLSVSAFTTAQGIAYRGTAPDSGLATLRTEDAYNWRATGAQLTHRWLLGASVRQRVQLRTSRHALVHDASMAMSSASLAVSGGERNEMEESTLAADWRWTVSNRVSADIGTEISRANSSLHLANRVLQPLAMTTSVWRGALFADVTTQLRATLFADAGLRVTQLQSGRTYAEPRVSLRGESGARGVPWSWRLSGGGYHQFVTQFDVASTMPVAFVPNVRFWLPSDGASPVAQAWHVAAEGVWRPAAGWEVRGESYAKWMPSIPLFDYGVLYRANGAAGGTAPRTAMDFVRSMNGRAMGAGVRVIRDARLRGGYWRHELAYDAGWAQRRFPSRFNERMQPPPWLEPHRVLFVSELTPVRRITIAARARGVVGRPWALRQVYYDLFSAAPDRAGLPIDLPGEMKRPALLEADLGATWTHRVRSSTVVLGMSVTNVFNRANVLDYGLIKTPAGRYDMVPRLLPRRVPAITLALRP